MQTGLNLFHSRKIKQFSIVAGISLLGDDGYLGPIINEESGDTASLFLREENGIIYQYEACCEEDTIRLPAELKVGYKWKTADNLSQYEIISIDSELKTPVCSYKNLLVIKLTVKNGSFQFYYLKGFGYIGATNDEGRISFVTPQKPTKD